MKKFNPLECMMMDIVDFGEKSVWKDVELIACPFGRIHQRKLFFKAKEELNRRSKGQ